MIYEIEGLSPVTLILGKVAKFLLEKLSTSEVISRKPHGGGGGTPLPPSAFGVKNSLGNSLDTDRMLTINLAM